MKASFNQLSAEAEGSEDAGEGESGEEDFQGAEEADSDDEQHKNVSGVPSGKEPEVQYGSEAEEAGRLPGKAAPAPPSSPHGSVSMKLSHDTPRVGYADGQEACSAIGCHTVASGAGPKNPITGENSDLRIDSGGVPDQVTTL